MKRFQFRLAEFIAIAVVLGASSIAPAFGASAPPAFITNGLVAYYPYDGNTSDYTGNTTENTTLNIELGADRYGNPARALHLYRNRMPVVSLLNPAIPTGYAPMTVSLWIQIENPTLPPVGFTLYQVFGKPSDSKTAWSFNFIFQGNGIDFTPEVGSSTSSTYHTYFRWSLFPNLSTALKWHHLTLSFRSETETALFLDGNLVAWETRPNPESTFRAPGPFFLGGNPPGDSFNGLFDEVRIYNRALSDQEIKALYSLEGPPTIDLQPANISATLGSTTALNVAATSGSDATLTYQWFKDGTPLPNGTNAALTFQNLVPANVGDYFAIVETGSLSTTSRVASVTIPGLNSGLWKGLVAYYPFGGNAVDHSGFGADGELYNETATTDRLETPQAAYSFSSRQLSGIIAPTESLPTGGSSRTFSVWIKPTPGIKGEFVRGEILGYGDVNGSAGSIFESFIWQPDTNVVTLSLGSDTFGWSQDVIGWNFTKWHHLVWTLSSSNSASLYLDGTKLTVRNPLVAGARLNTTHHSKLIVGYYTGSYFNGGVDDIRIYNRALFSAEVTAIYNFEKSLGTDTDQDGVTDYFEFNVSRTDPFNPDSDNDGVVDGDEIAESTDPLSPLSGPAPRILSATNFQTNVGLAFSAGIQVKYPVTGYDFVGLPNGLTGNPQSGDITGFLTTAGTNMSTLVLKNQWGSRANNLLFTIARGIPLITWNPPTSAVFGSTLGTNFFSPTSSIAGSFTFDPLLGSPLQSVTASNATVHFVPADTNNYESVTVTKTFNVLKADQVITFVPPPETVLGDAPIPLLATASSGRAVQFEVVSGPGQLFSTNLTILGGGKIVIRATQFGDSRYNAATPIERTIDVRLRLNVTTVGGSVLKEPNTPTLPYGQLVVLTAIPDAGRSFEGWSGDFRGKSNPLTIVLTNNATITPLFNPVWVLTLTNTFGGTVSTEPGLSQVKNGSSVIAVAIPSDGYGFRGWKGTIASAANPLEFVLNTNVTLVADFGRILSVAIKPTTDGTIVVTPSNSQYLEGDLVTLQATPANGYRFQTWKDPLQTLTNGATVTLTSNIVVEAVFKTLQTIVITQIGEGTVTVPGGTNVDLGESITISAQAKSGWVFTGWTGTITNDFNPLTVVVGANTTVQATFKKLFTLTATGTTGGVVKVTPQATNYTDGTTVTVQAIPDRYFRLDQWTGVTSGAKNPLTLLMTNNLGLTAVFGPSHSLKVSLGQDFFDGFRLMVDGENGIPYVIEVSSGLSSWTPLSIVTNSGAPIEFLDKQARSISRRFYRLRPEGP